MHNSYVLALLFAVPFLLSGCGQSDQLQTATEPANSQASEDSQTSEATLGGFEGMGKHSRKISTASDVAQYHFDQGLNWMYAFNHDEAIRSFLKAAEADPASPMPWWGIAYCEGPNYNDSIMTPARNKAAWYALQNALARLGAATPVERHLILALTKRYANPAPEDRQQLEQSYADAMAGVFREHPNDSDVATLYAESMMVQRPWMLYSLDGEPAENTDEIVRALETAMKLDQNNPGARHLYIHAVEPSRQPERGLQAARELEAMVPASGHMLHMPSHIYVKTGYWEDAIDRNVKAMAADNAYLQISPNQGIQHVYMVHNAHMLAFAAMMVGREKEAIQSARAMWKNVPEPVLKQIGPVVDLWMCSIYDVQKRFGRWDALLQEAAPPEYLPVTNAIWRAHRAIAYAAKKDFENAKKEQELFEQALQNIPEDHVAGLDPAHRILQVSKHFIAGEIALQQEDWEAAIRHLEQGAGIEDTLSYGEPPQWLQPIRHALGAVYLKAGKPAEAERTYQQDLAKWPNNGWSLYGLARALEMQGKHEAAKQARQRYELAWKKADEPTETSCKCIPKT